MRVLTVCFLVILLIGKAHAQEIPLISSKLVIAPQFQTSYDTTFEVNLPRGFSINVFYTSNALCSPRFLSFDPQGRLCVADQCNSYILALPDADHDGVADSAIVIASETNHAH